MAINFIKKEDLSHITRTTRQWETTIDRYEIIPKGVLCIELCNDKLTKIKIGNGHLIYEQLPYVSDVNLSDYYTKEETNTLLKNLKSIKIKGEASSLSDLPSRGNEDGDLWFVKKQDPETRNRYDEYVWYNNKWESFGSSDIDLSEYAKKSYVDEHIQEVQDEITEIIESGYLHKHNNKNILDQTSAVYNVEKDNKLRDLHNYDDSELREKAHTHLNKNILDQTDAVYNRDKDDKLASLHNYDDTSVKERISSLESVSHSHSNQDVLDRTTAAFTKEQALTLLDCKDFKGTDGVHSGYHGFVPAPTKDDIGKVLGANGEWVEGGSSGGDTVTEGGGISITTDAQTGNKVIAVNAGTGLEIDQQTGELNVTATGGDTITEGGGISITTDQQTGDKIISVNAGDNLEVDQVTGELNVTGVDYSAGNGIRIGSNYNFIEYIKNSGNYDQIILTDILPKYDDTLEIDMRFGVGTGLTNNTGFYGVRQNSVALYCTSMWVDSNDTWTTISTYNHFDYVQGQQSHVFSVSTTAKYQGNNPRQFFTVHQNIATWGNDTINFANQYDSSLTDPTLPFAIFGRNMNGTLNPFYTFELYVYGVKLYDSNNVLIHDLRPVERVSDNEAGLYDVITNKFYGNAGNGSFVKGPDVTTPDRIINTKIGDGLQFDSNDAIEVNTGDGLSVNQNNELDINTGDGLSINNNNEIELDKATTTTIGGIIVGDNLSIDNTGKISADEYTPGEGISIDSNKEVSVKYNSNGLSINASDELELDKATKNSIGGVIVGDNINVSNGTISVPVATDSSLGVVNPTDGLSVDNTGELSVNTGDGLSINQDNEIEINIGEGLSIDENNVVSSTVYEEGQGITFETSGSADDGFDVKNKEYYFEDEARCEITGNFGPRSFWRAYTDDPCLAVIFYRSDTTTAPMYIGITENSVKIKQSWDGNVLGPDGTFDYKGYTWYYTFNYGLYYSSGVDQLGHLQTVSGTSADEYEDVAKHVIDLAELVTPGIQTYDVWNSGTGWLNGDYGSGTDDTFYTNWYKTFHSKQNEYFEIPEGATQVKLTGISTSDTEFGGNHIDLFNDAKHHIGTFSGESEWKDILTGAVYLQFGVKWNEQNTQDISGSQVKSVTLEIKVPKNNAITAKLGDGLTFDENDAITLDESIKLIIHCVGTPLT